MAWIKNDIGWKEGQQLLQALPDMVLWLEKLRTLAMSYAFKLDRIYALFKLPQSRIFLSMINVDLCSKKHAVLLPKAIYNLHKASTALTFQYLNTYTSFTTQRFFIQNFFMPNFSGQILYM